MPRVEAVDPRAEGRVLGSTPDDILIAGLVAATAEATRVNDESTHATRRRAMFALADRLDALARDLAAARAEAEGLRKALAPFAEAGRHIPASWNDARPAAHVNSDARHPGTVTTIPAGDFRRAARASGAEP